jgi:alpha-L-fucosidase
MMKELFTNYGPIWELWWDGANGEGTNGKKQVYDWVRFKATVRKLSPSTVIFSDVGPDIRWCGNESGMAGKTNWNMLDTDGFEPGAKAPSTDTLNAGNINGKYWIPAECDVSIRPGWFYHKAEDEKVKMPAELFQLYLKSVGRGANLLLNVPPDGNGLITPFDSVALAGFKKLREDNLGKKIQFDNISYSRSAKSRFKDNQRLNDDNPSTFAKFDKDGHGKISLFMKTGVPINCIVLKEHIKKGQTISKIKIEYTGWGNNDSGTKEIETITTIGSKRIITFPTVRALYITITILNAKAKAMINDVEGYYITDNLIEK